MLGNHAHLRRPHFPYCMYANLARKSPGIASADHARYHCRQQAEQALQESEARYKRLVASVTDYIYSVKIKEGKVVSLYTVRDVSPSLAIPPQITRRSRFVVQDVHADDRDKVLDQARRLPMGETVPPLEHRILHKNGQIRWVRNTAVIHRDSRNRVEAYDGLISDITERKLAEEQINAHAHKLEIINRVIMAVNKASSPADALDEALRSALELMQFRSGCIYLVNTTTGTADICCANGCKSDFITDMARVDMNDSRYATLIKSGHAAFDGNCRITYPELAEQWDIAAMARLPLISQDKTIGWLLLADSATHDFTPAEQDILLSIARQIGTALAKAGSESALRESENRYRTITEQSLVGIQIIKNNQLIFVNEGWTAITSYTRRDLEHWSNRDFLQSSIRMTGSFRQSTGCPTNRQRREPSL